MLRLKLLSLGLVGCLVLEAHAQSCCQLSEGFTSSSGLNCTQRWLRLGGAASVQAAWKALQQKEFVPYRDSIGQPHPAWERDSVFLSFCLHNDTDEAIDVLAKFRDLRGVWLWAADSLIDLPFHAFNPGLDAAGLLTMPEREYITHRLAAGETATFLYRAHYPYWSGLLFPQIHEIKHYERQKGIRMGYITLLNGAVFGIAFIFMLIVLLVYTQIRDKTLTAYSLYIGISLVYFWRDFEFLNLQFYTTLVSVRWIHTKTIFPVAICLSYILFVRRLLDTPRHFPRLNQMMSVFFIVMPPLILIDQWLLVYRPSWSYYITPHGASWLMWGGVLVLNYTFWGSKDIVVRYVAWGSLFLILGGMAISALPTHIHEWVVRGAFIVELCCFTAAIAYRIKLSLDEKQKLQQILVEQEKQMAIDKAVEAERIRSRIAQDIHDEAGASLTKISLGAEMAARTSNLGEPELRTRLSKLSTEARQTAQQLREIIFSINPDFDRFNEMQAYFRETANAFWGDTNVICHFDFEKSAHNPIVPPDIKRQLLLIFKEAQTNAAKYAQAQNIWLSMKLLNNNTYFIEVRDDGCGMPPNHVPTHTQGQSGMLRRAKSIGAELEIDSQVGWGVRICITGEL